jgi:uncharacterized membrane protein
MFFFQKSTLKLKNKVKSKQGLKHFLRVNVLFQKVK